ncbi:hypothetical protein [Flavobacterium alkalisoli]|uniref:hypothetical protein n=1 Tax=Flavobacterium alkalisoli TaxID=2602769 RepID=UPI003A9087AE
MKKSIYLLFILSLFGCSSYKQVSDERDYSKGIVYVLPGKVQKALKPQMQPTDKRNGIYFTLKELDGDKYRIYIQEYSVGSVMSRWVNSTNRYILVDAKLYPLLFELDDKFGVTETVEELLTNEKAGIYEYTRRYVNREYVHHVEFTRDGTILYEGNSLTQPLEN